MTLKWRAATVLLAFLLTHEARGQDKPVKMLLLDRRVEIRAFENLAFARITLRVKNPTDRLVESSTLLKLPAGGCGVDLGLLRNKPADQRMTRFLAPAEADKLYKNLKEGEAKIDENETVEILITADGKVYVPATQPGHFVEREFQREIDKATGSSSEADPGRIKARQYSNRYCDPAILETMFDDTVRIRAFPVLPFDDQEVTVTVAWVLPDSGSEYKLELPLPDPNLFDVQRSARTQYVAMFQSSDALRIIDSSQAWTSAGESTSTRYLGSAVGGALDSLLFLRLSRGATAQPVDFSTPFDPATWTPAVPTAFESYEKSVRAKKTIDALGQDLSEKNREKTRDLGIGCRVATSESSLLLVERRLTRGTAGKRPPPPPPPPPPGGSKNPPPPPPPAPKVEDVGLETALKCDVARRLFELGGLGRSVPCGEYTVTTDDAEKIKCATDNGLKPKPTQGTLGYYTYTCVKHSRHCTIMEANPRKLADLVTEAMKKR